jgi:hypothetical protein
MKEISAKSNVIPSLVVCGLLTDDGTPTALARRWREDNEYPAVCKEMSARIYPDELRDAAPGPDVDREAVERWFRSHTGFGVAAAKRYALVYSLIESAMLPEDAPRERSRSRAIAGGRMRRESRPTTEVKGENVDGHVGGPRPNGQRPSFEPAINLNIQVHVSPDMSPEQIDQIFKSMARHFYPNS